MITNTYKIIDGIAVTLRSPEGESGTPAIILCHGFCGIQDILLPAFADAFTKAGFTTVTFDYLGFGASEGERGRLVPSMQIQDILSVIDWTTTLLDIDAGRIGLWGTSLGACHVFGAAVERPEIKCIVSQMGFADGEKIVTGSMSQEDKTAFVATLDKMAEKRKNTGKEMFVAITKVLADEESKAFFETNKHKFPAMDIKIPFLTVRETLLYKPSDNAAKTTCPTLVVIAGKDTVNPPEQGIALYDAVASKTKSLCVMDDTSHYEIYAGEQFDNVIRLQLNWFKEYLM